MHLLRAKPVMLFHVCDSKVTESAFSACRVGNDWEDMDSKFNDAIMATGGAIINLSPDKHKVEREILYGDGCESKYITIGLIHSLLICAFQPSCQVTCLHLKTPSTFVHNW